MHANQELASQRNFDQRQSGIGSLIRIIPKSKLHASYNVKPNVHVPVPPCRSAA